jgi:hypothetical protein
MYEAIVCRIRTSAHPNANQLLLGDAAGYSVMVGIDTSDGDLGILFPEGGCLSPEFCLANGLYRKHPVTGEPTGGYLDEAGRVRTLKLRGAVSEGLWLPIDAVHVWLAQLGESTSPYFIEGDRLTEVAGRRLCEKYLTPATRRAIAAHGAGSKQARASHALPRHYDTCQLRDLQTVPASLDGTIIAVFTEKVHGTSGRTGRVLIEQPLGRLASFWNRCVPAFLAVSPKQQYEYVSGTRNCVLVAGAPGEKGQDYRRQVHDAIVDVGLDDGEVWYYEIAGYDTNGRPIMATHSVASIGDAKLEASLRKEYGSTITYEYGCNGQGHHVYVYRITVPSATGDRELTYNEIVHRCRGTGFGVVPRIASMPAPEGASGAHWVRQAAARMANDPDHVWFHPREGVCVRFESAFEVLSRAYKHKSFVFCALEGIARNDAEYVDTEEVA